MHVAMPEPLKSADEALAAAFALLGCERPGGASENGWSGQSDFLRCPYRYFLKHERHAAPRMLAASSKALDIGAFAHAFLAAHYARLLPAPFLGEDGQLQCYPGWQANMPDPEQLFETLLQCGAEVEALTIAKRVWDGYLERWCDDGWQPLAVELPAGRADVHTSRYDLIFSVEDGIHDGLWIGEHKTASDNADREQWDLHGEVLGEIFSWDLSKLDSYFGTLLRGVCLNVLFKGTASKAPTYFRIWKTVEELKPLVTEFVRARFHWRAMEETYRRAGVWPKSFYGCQARFDRCCYWDHCVTLSDSHLILSEVSDG